VGWGWAAAGGEVVKPQVGGWVWGWVVGMG
jgi:hypothetical protein